MFVRFIVGGREKRDYFIWKGSSKDKKFMLAKVPWTLHKTVRSFSEKLRPRDGMRGSLTHSLFSFLLVEVWLWIPAPERFSLMFLKGWITCRAKTAPSLPLPGAVGTQTGGKGGENRPRVMPLSSDHREWHLPSSIFFGWQLGCVTVRGSTPPWGWLRARLRAAPRRWVPARRLQPLPGRWCRCQAPVQRCQVTLPARVKEPSTQRELGMPVFVNKAVTVHKSSRL